MKRGASGLSLVVGVDKPAGMTSHDVISRVRRIFGEKRVGHAGTLDPLATGALPVLVGPATRLNAYLTCEDKTYDAGISFGIATDTDDAQGEVVARAHVPAHIHDAVFAEELLAGMVGAHMQIPPAYSAIKVNGKKACDEARRGRALRLEARRIEIYHAQLLGIAEDARGNPVWNVRFHVSKGTYIRSLARDIGKAANTCAHISTLRRVSSGNLHIEDCVSLETLEDIGVRAALDVVKLLGYRFVFLDEAAMAKVKNGMKLSSRCVQLYEYTRPAMEDICCCTSGVAESAVIPVDGETVSLVGNNRLEALYTYSEARGAYVPSCVFQSGVARGSYC